MTDEVKKEETGPKSPGWISNRIAEAIRGLRGAPRNPWTHMLVKAAPAPKPPEQKS